MSSILDFQQPTQWVGDPLYIADTLALPAGVNTLVTGLAVGNFQSLVIPVAAVFNPIDLRITHRPTNGPSQLFAQDILGIPNSLQGVYTLPLFGDRISTVDAIVPAGGATLYTALVPANTTAVFGPPGFGSSLLHAFNTPIGAGTTLNLDLPPYAGWVNFFLTTGSGAPAISFQMIDQAGGFVGYVWNGGVLAGGVVNMTLRLPYRRTRLQVSNPGAATTYTADITAVPAPLGG